MSPKSVQRFWANDMHEKDSLKRGARSRDRPQVFGATAMSIQSQQTADSAYKDPMKILVVEDDREAADYLEKAFSEAGHTAHVASDGESGFVLAAEGDYDVLVVDRMLPRRDGLSLIAGLRSRGNTT